MAFLICVFASPKSRREKIQEWLEYLDGLERLHGSYPDRLDTIHTLRARAISWLDGGSEPRREPWRAVPPGAVVPAGDTVPELTVGIAR